VNYILMHPLFILFLIALGLFGFLVIGLVLARRTIRYLIEDLSLARHLIMSWFIAPVFRIYFLLLEISGKLQVTVNAHIPWEEKRLVFVGNHAMPKLQDTFLMPPIIFYRNLSKLRNPIRYFPFTIADEGNFVKNRFFRYFAGPHYLESVNRTAIGKMQAKSVIEGWKKRLMEISSFLIANIEGGRTQSAESWIFSKNGNKLGKPTRGIAILVLETNSTVVSYWGSIVNVPYWKFSPQALFWKFLERIFRKYWQKIGFYTARPKPCPQTVLWGLIELLFNPGIKAFIDINHPSGPIRPKVGEENSRELTARIATALLEIGDYQLDRIQKGRKK